MKITTFGTLGKLTWRESGAPSFLDRLLQAGSAVNRQRGGASRAGGRCSIATLQERERREQRGDGEEKGGEFFHL